MSLWTVFWIVFGVLFLVIEFTAIWRHRIADTLTFNNYRWFAIYNVHAPLRNARRSVLVLFMVNLLLHLLGYLKAHPWVTVPGIGVAACIVLSTFVWKERS
jgi:hypothetical protein